MKALTLVLLLAGLVLGADPAAEAFRKERKALQGTWVVESAKFGGKDATIRGSKLSLTFLGEATLSSGKVTKHTFYRMNHARKLKELDFVIEKPDGTEVFVPAIYEIKDDTMTLVAGAAPGKLFPEIPKGKAKPTPARRPESFDDKSALQMTLKRQK